MAGIHSVGEVCKIECDCIIGKVLKIHCCCLYIYMQVNVECIEYSQLCFPNCASNGVHELVCLTYAAIIDYMVIGFKIAYSF